MFEAVWKFRHFIIASIRGEFKSRIARSYVGAGWFILQPLAQALIFAMVLAEGLGARLPNSSNKYDYVVYVLSGMAAWGFFSEIVNRSLNIFIDFGPTLKKISFPRLCLPMIVLGSALVNHCMVLLASLILFCVVGHYPGWAWLAVPLGTVLLAAYAFGIGLIAGIFNVFSRDVGQTVAVLLQIWFWLTPIAYPPDTLPAGMRWILNYNPLVPVVQIYQDALLRYQWPQLSNLVVPTIIATALLSMAFVLFRRAGPEMVDAL